MTLLDFSDRSSPGGRVWEQLSGASFWFNDDEISRSFGRAIPNPAGDAISVATACYAADRIIRRTGANRGRRELEIRLPVEADGAWTEAGPALERYLAALTSDRWQLTFLGGRPLRTSESQLQLLPTRSGPTDAVALFSGGLDSFAGAALWLEANPTARLTLVGARSSWVIGRDQQRLVGILRDTLGDRVDYIGIPIQLRDNARGESSQRTRSFLFVSLAVAAAITAGIRVILVFENGFGAVNPRLAENQVDHHVNRGTHPRVLAMLREALESLGLRAEIALPHLHETKAEMLKRLPPPVATGISQTASCDAYPLRSPRGSHCGTCGSCLLRRESLLVAQLSRHDRRDYLLNWQRPDAHAPIARLMARQAWMLRRWARPEHWNVVRWNWPELADAIQDPDSLDGRLLLDVFRRYGNEWEAIADRHMHIRRFAQPPQHVEDAA